MAYKVRAFRSENGVHGIKVATLFDEGYDSSVAEFTLFGGLDVEAFVADCLRALARAQSFAEPTQEPKPLSSLRGGCD